MYYRVRGEYKTIIRTAEKERETKRAVWYKRWNHVSDSFAYYRADKMKRTVIDQYYVTENYELEIHKIEKRIIIAPKIEVEIEIVKDLKTEKTKIYPKKGSNGLIISILEDDEWKGCRSKSRKATQEELMIAVMKIQKRFNLVSSWEEENLDKTEKKVYEVWL